MPAQVTQILLMTQALAILIQALWMYLFVRSCIIVACLLALQMVAVIMPSINSVLICIILFLMRHDSMGFSSCVPLNVLYEGATDAANVRRAPSHMATGPNATYVYY